MRVWRKSACLMMVAGAICAQTLARADQEGEIALQRALDQPLTLSLDKVDLSEAFKQIAGAAKISLQVDAGCYDALPYGSTTRVTADFRQSKLRDALEEVLVPLGLQMVVSGDAVVIRPTGPLARIGRRAEWEELKLLKELRTVAEIKPPARGAASGAAGDTGGGGLDLATALRAAVENRKDLALVISGENGPGGTGPLHDKAIEQIQKQLPLPAFRVLEMYCQLTNSVWFVEAGPMAGGETGGTVYIMPQKLWIARQLERPIQMSRTNAALEEVVADLMHASGIRFVPEAGLYQAVPVVTLSSSNGSVKQTLEALQGATRIAYEVRDDGILLQLAAGAGGGAGGGGGRADTIIGRIAVPVGSDGLAMDVFIRESDLPPELNEAVKKKIRESVAGLQKTWGAGGGAAGGGGAAVTQPMTAATQGKD